MAKKKNTKVKNRNNNQIDRAVNKTAPQKRKTKKGQALKILLKVLKWLIIIGVIIAFIIFFLTSPVFNVKQIEVNGNDKISDEDIITLSEIETGVNIYKYSKSNIKEKVKQNSYIADVQVFRILPDKIEIEVQERKATFLLEMENTFAYINNQGYVLELNKENIYLPIITGFSTSVDNIIAGKQLEEDDLKKLQVVLNIMDIATSNQIAELITKIDISDANNYTLVLDTESKIAYLGTSSDMNMKILYLKGLLQREKGIAGEIFLKDEYIKSDRVFFREKV